MPDARRVAIVYDCLFPIDTGGGERVYDRMADAFVARGRHVDYVTRTQWDGPPPERAYAVHGVWRGELYDAAGTRTTASALGFALGVFRWLRRHRRDVDLVVVAALPVLNVFAARLALLGRRVPLVTDWLEVWSAAKWRSYAGTAVGTVAFLLQWAGLRLGALQTVNSAFTADRVRRYRRRAEPVVPGLVDLAGLEPRCEAAAAPPYALFVGRHIPDKRLAALPAALAAARREHPGLTAIVTGAGPETPAARLAARQAEVEDAVDFVGRVDDARLERLFAQAAVLVNPSAREGFGLVVVEAAAHGTPSVVVAGEDNAAAELVVDGVNGVVADAVDAEVLGAAIARTVSGGPGLRRSTSEWYARERVARSLDRSVGELLDRLDRAR